MTNKFVVMDLETTGNLPKKGEKIIQIGAVVIEDGRITERFASLINPQKPIPIFIEELTGINNEMVRDAPLFSEIAEKVYSLLDDAYFVAHNVLFDLSFLQEELQQAGFEGFYGSVLDTVEMARIVYPTADGYKLSDLAELENLQHNRPHQADSDAEVTAELFLILLRRLAKLPKVTLEQLFLLAGGLKSDLQQLLEEMLTNDTFAGEIPDSIEIVQNLALKKADESVVSKDVTIAAYPETTEEKTAIVKNGFRHFEQRSGQFTMMDMVYQSFQEERHSLIEAGTGVGKTLGYLLPAAYFSRTSPLPIVISTYTVQLQEQIIQKEVPLLKKLVPFHLNAVLLKGRNHYISLERFQQTLTDEDDNYDTTLTKMQILVWLTETETGDKDELNLSSGGLIYWNKIKNISAISPDNPVWIEKDFYLKARTKAEHADLIITNHSLLLSDIKEKSTILPKYDFAVIDEAHQFERAATQLFGYSLDYLSTRMLLGQFGLYEQKQLFYELEDMLRGFAETEQELLHTVEFSKLVADLFYEMDDFFGIITVFAKSKREHAYGSNRVKIRFSQVEDNKEKRALINSAERFSFLLKDLISAVNPRLNYLNERNTFLTEYQKTKVEAIQSFLGEIDELRNTVIHCFLQDSGQVKWIEMDFRSPHNVTTFLAQPASVAQRLKEQFFSKKKGVVLTSATLTVNQSFDFKIKGLGLESFSPMLLNIASPFDYKNQIQLLIPDDLPEINTVSVDEYVISITEHIISIAEAAKGRMMILFTSYEMLKKTYDLIKESEFLEEYVLIAQGITSGSRTRLTRNFQRYDKAILLGTGSFWEGIDIPGDDLSCLVIVRLPFSPPDEPLTEAKYQLIKQQGGNPFTEYSLPEAVLRFKQGVGRLIRTESDRGIVIVFDKRIITTKYGRSFLNSIPPISVKRGKMDKLVDRIVEWI